MKLIHRSEISKPIYKAIQWPYWMKTAIAATTVGAINMYASPAATPAAGNIEDGGKLSTVYPHIITGFAFLPHTAEEADIELLINGILMTFEVTGKKVLDNVMAKACPLDVGVHGGVATTNTTKDMRAVSFKGPRFNLGDWIPILKKGESVVATLNIPAALGALSVTTDVSFWTLTRKVGYIG